MITGKFIEGNPGGGRPLLTEEDRLKKKATEEYITEYKERLAEALPLISPVLIARAIEGEIAAIKEVNDRVMGRATQKMDVDLKGGMVLVALEETLKQICEEESENTEDGSDSVQGRDGEAIEPDGGTVGDIQSDIQEALQ